MLFTFFFWLSLGLLDNNLFCLSLLAPQTVSGGPPSYICRLSGKSDVDWSFWLEVMDNMLCQQTHGPWESLPGFFHTT
jgi:hypothetical protein